MKMGLMQSTCESCDAPVYCRVENPYDLVASCQCQIRNMVDKVITGSPMKKGEIPHVTSWFVKINEFG